VDYHGSRVVALERLRWPTGGQIVGALDRAFALHGKPLRLLSDRGPAFTSERVRQFLTDSRVQRTLTRPAHPWTNGRIERVFRTFKSTVYGLVWLLSSLKQVDRFCADFLAFYNGRPHSSYGGLTPNEVAAGITLPALARGRVSYFDGHLNWYVFG
jgi:putative transposase